MRLFSSKINNLLSRPTVTAVYLVSVGIYRVTTHHSDVIANGVTYAADSNLLSVQPPQQSSSVDTQSYTIAFVEPGFTFGVATEEGLIGQPTRVYVCLVNPDTGVLETASEDLILVYAGQVSGSSYQVGLEEVGSVIYTLTCTSPMANLDLVRPFYGSKSFMRSNIKPDDSTFDYVYEGGGKARLMWGKV